MPTSQPKTPVRARPAVDYLSVAFALAVTVGLGGSLLGLVGAQGMTGRETLGMLVRDFGQGFLLVYSLGGAIGFVPAVIGRCIRTYGLVVLALLSGAVISAVLVAVTARTFAFILLALPIVCIPPLLGFVVVHLVRRTP